MVDDASVTGSVGADGHHDATPPACSVPTGAQRPSRWAAAVAFTVFAAGFAFDATRLYAAALVVLAVVVAVHEAGHLFAARACGVGAPEFSIGFGPLLWRSRPDRHGTRYVLRAVPVGGYVRIDGMAGDSETPPVPHKRSYADISAPRRVLITAAGPAANVALAFVLLAGVFGAAGVERASTTVMPVPGAPAAVAGVEPGDRIVSVAGSEVGSWDGVRAAVAAHDDAEPLVLGVERDGTLLEITVAVGTPPGGRIGLVAQLEREHLSAARAVGLSVQATATMTASALGGVGGIAKALLSTPGHLAGTAGDSSDNRLLSPIGAAQLAERSAADYGPIGPVTLVAGVSVFVAVFNLLPVPPLDGGHAAIAAYEGVASRLRGRQVRVSRERLAPVTVAVVSAVLVLGVVSVILDVLRPVAVP